MEDGGLHIASTILKRHCIHTKQNLERHRFGAQQAYDMCTQEIVWCSCGHGELLPIVRCSHAQTLGKCWIVVHGDHRVLVQMKCSYCLNTPRGSQQLSTKARPEGELALKIEGGEKDEKQQSSKVFLDEGITNSAGAPPPELDDVVHTDWSDFSLDPELWQYM